MENFLTRNQSYYFFPVLSGYLKIKIYKNKAGCWPMNTG